MIGVGRQSGSGGGGGYGAICSSALISAVGGMEAREVEDTVHFLAALILQILVA